MGEKWRILGWFFEPELKKWGRMGLETGIEGGVSMIINGSDYIIPNKF